MYISNIIHINWDVFKYAYFTQVRNDIVKLQFEELQKFNI